MATVTLSVKKTELKKILLAVKPEHREVDRPLTEDIIFKFFRIPQDQPQAVDAEDFIERAIARKDIEAIIFQCGRNPDDGFAIIELKEFTTQEYVDEHEKPCGEYYLLLVLGSTLKTNVQA